MPAYTNPSRTIKITLPSSVPSDPALIVGPGEISFWDETRIMSKTQHTRQSSDGQPENVIDNAMFEYLLVHTWLENPDTSWNLYDEQGHIHERSTAVIDKIFQGERGRADRQHIAAMLAYELFPDMVPKKLEEQQEGNAQAASSTPPPTNTDFLSTLEASTSLENTAATGSMPTPMARPEMAAPSAMP